MNDEAICPHCGIDMVAHDCKLRRELPESYAQCPSCKKAVYQAEDETYRASMEALTSAVGENPFLM